MAEQLLNLTNICKSFAGVQALDHVNLTINRGEICCLAGENGSGKSTLIKVVAGVVTPDQGEILIDSKQYKRLRPIDSIREGIQIIYQDFSLFPNLTVAENIALNHQLAQNRRFINWQEVYRVAGEAIKKINVSIDLKAKVEELSVADKQLVAISRALLQNAKLIIMDEPTTALTQREIKSLFKVVKNLQQEGISILFVSHKLDEVLEISDKITILRNGRNVTAGETRDFDRAKLIYFMTGREIGESLFVYTNDQLNLPKLLQVDKLSSKGCFSDITFELLPGEIVGITGLLGSGRTELALALFGQQPADSGEIFINGKRTKLSSINDAIKHGIGYVPEDRLTEGLFLQQSIGKNILASTITRLINRFRFIDTKKSHQEIDNWVHNLSIVTPSSHLPVQTLSGGNQQRVVLAKWLATNPRLLILNGPTVGVDIGSKADIHEIIKGLAAQGMGVLIISDDIPELLQNCNRVLLMRKGRIVEEFAGNSITESELALKLIGA